MSTSSKIKELTRKNNIQFLLSEYANLSRQSTRTSNLHENNLIQTQKTGVTFFVRHGGLRRIFHIKKAV